MIFHPTATTPLTPCLTIGVHFNGSISLPNSPDFNPIEPAWSKVKQLLRGAKARTLEVLETTLAEALSAITALNASAWFAHCAYAL